MAYRRITRLQTDAAAWHQVELLPETQPGWSDAQRVETPRLLLPEHGSVQIELDGKPLAADVLTGVWLTPERPYRVRHARTGQRSSLLVIGAVAAEGLAPGPVRIAASWRLRLRLLAAARRTATHHDHSLAHDEAMATLIAETWPAPSVAPPHRAVDRVRALLAERFTENDSLADLGRDAACSPFQLARQFRRSTGRSLHEHRTELRLAEALRRLDGGERNLSRLAAELGFASHSHFSAVFRRLLGHSPAALRTILTARPAG